MKIGLMVPMNNTTMERELSAWVGNGTTCQTLRIPRGAGLLTPETVPAYLSSALQLAERFEDVDTVVYGCTAAGFMMGPEADRKLAAQLGDITGRRVVTTARAMVETLRDEKVKRVAVATPYLEAVNRQLERFLVDSGFEVPTLKTLGARNTEELGRINAAQVAGLARETMRPDCDALFIACTQLPTYEILPQLEQELGRPVWSAIQVCARAVLQ